MRKMDKKRTLRVVTITLVLLSGILSGCKPQPVTQAPPTLAITPGVVETSTLEASQQPTATITSTPVAIQTQDPIASAKTAYTFEADLDYNKHNLLVRQSIQYQNNTGRDLSHIKLVVPANAKENVFSLTSLSLSGDAGMADYSLEGVTLTIQLDQPLINTGSISIDLEYELSPKLQGGVLGYTAKQINFSDWYPFVPPYDAANGWIIHQPSVVGEYLVYNDADFDLTLNLLNASGLVVAGSAEVAPLDLDTFKMVQKDSRGITFSVSDQYTVLTNTTNGVTVRGYIFKGDEIAGQASVDYTANALQLYSELFGVPYPHQTMSVVESDFPDGMEYDGLYYLSDFYYKLYDGTPQNYLALLSVHETAHQWWFGVVGNDQALEPWLDESLATYSEYLYIERYHPELANWWWDYRVAYYKPAGRVNLTIYDQSDLRVYINAVYLQGAVFLDKLRQELGDDVFFAGLRLYASTYNHKLATWDEFLKIMAPDPSDTIKALIQESFR
jgi:hypothetical protein